MPVRKGLTLLELILVMMIIVMLAAMAYPSIESMYVDMRLQAGADHLRAKFAEARSRAIDDLRPYRFAVKPGTSSYKVAPDSPEFWGEGSATDDDSGVEPLVLEGELPDQIVFEFGAGFTMSGTGEWSTLVVFNPDGTCSEDRTIRLEMEDARPIEISLRALTGSVTAKSAPVGGAP